MHGAPKPIPFCPVPPRPGHPLQASTLDTPDTPHNESLLTPPKTPYTPILSQKPLRNPDILDHTLPALAIPSHEIGVEPSATPKSRYGNLPYTKNA